MIFDISRRWWNCYIREHIENKVAYKVRHFEIRSSTFRRIIKFVFERRDVVTPIKKRNIAYLLPNYLLLITLKTEEKDKYVCIDRGTNSEWLRTNFQFSWQLSCEKLSDTSITFTDWRWTWSLFLYRVFQKWDTSERNFSTIQRTFTRKFTKISPSKRVQVFPIKR